VRALLAVKGMFGSVLLDAELVRDLAADLLDAHAALDAHRTRAEAEALRAIVEGRVEAPTDAEVAAHLAAGGDWLVRRVASELARETCEAPMCSRVVRWWPLDDAGRPTTWPEVQP
jgi:hypothetical protein